MRLLNIDTLSFSEFSNENRPEYVILSHRWDDAELSFKEYCKNQNITGAGYRKIIEFCNFVRDGLPEDEFNFSPSPRSWKWVWIDTCRSTACPDSWICF
jgi:hypothetical protein